jgi:NADPH-dependent ferric siderophore reductase/SAM-dependent methyltransferase
MAGPRTQGAPPPSAADLHWRYVVLRELQVLRVENVTPLMRRLTLGGPQLGAFEKDGLSLPPFWTDAPDDHVKLVPAAPGLSAPVLPEQRDGFLEWPHGSIHRSYTPRRFDPGAGELDIDIVLHEGGVVADLARRARPGDTLHLAGPKLSRATPEADAYVIAGDETALPAIGRWLEEMEPGVPAIAIVEVENAQEEQPLDTHVPVTWIHRDGRPAGGDLLERALRELDWPAGRVYVWAAGETVAMRDLRVHLRTERGLPRELVHVKGYWRRGLDGGTRPAARGRLHRLADLFPPHALRTLVTLGIPELLADGERPLSELAERSGADPRGLRSLLVGLTEHDVIVQPAPDRFALGEVGGELLEEEPRDALDLRGANAHLDLAWAGLEHAVRSGEPAFARVFGRPFWEQLDADPAFAASFDRYLEEWSKQWVPLALAAWEWESARHVVDAGGGTGRLLAGVLTANPEVTGTLLELPGTLARAAAIVEAAGLSERMALVPGDLFAPLPEGDVIVLAQVLHDWPDEAAARILAEAAHAAGSSGRVLVIDRVIGPHGRTRPQAGMDLRMRILFGGAERTGAELAELAAEAGLRVAAVRPVGYGLSLVELAPAA